MIELQKIDCNCNDCLFMIRDLERFKKSLSVHHKWQLDYFNSVRDNLLKKANDWENGNCYHKAEILKKGANKMKFQFNKKEVSINYGYCNKLNKSVSFIPNTCQLETQKCFIHRSKKPE